MSKDRWNRMLSEALKRREVNRSEVVALITRMKRQQRIEQFMFYATGVVIAIFGVWMTAEYALPVIA